MPQQCSHGISGSGVNHNYAECTYTEPDHFYTAATSHNGTPSSPPPPPPLHSKQPEDTELWPEH
eukprot:1152543-Pelagomonas_calceolata.AAC.1